MLRQYIYPMPKREDHSYGNYVLQFNAPEAVEHRNELNAFLLRHLDLNWEQHNGGHSIESMV